MTDSDTVNDGESLLRMQDCVWRCGARRKNPRSNRYMIAKKLYSPFILLVFGCIAVVFVRYVSGDSREGDRSDGPFALRTAILLC